MNHLFGIYLSAFGAAFIFACIATPLWRKWCIRTNLVDDPGHRKIHHTPIPLAGGLAVFTGLTLAVIAGFIVLETSLLPATQVEALRYGFDRRKWQLAAIIGGAVGMLLIGFFDDKWELKPAWKFSLQFLIALIVAAAGVRITLLIPNVLFSYCITIFWILAVINAFNFMDNMNGLCSGLGSLAALQFGLIAAERGQYLVALITFAAAGAMLGFLPFNFPRASAFLGDAGSHLVGYLLAVSAILPSFYTSENQRAWAVFAPLLILAVPLLDMLYVVLLRCKMGKPFYIGDTNHLSHRLVRRGFSQRTTVAIIWIIAALIGMLAFL